MDEIDNNSNPLIECPFCKKKMKGKSLAAHAKRVHANKDNVILFQVHNGKVIQKSAKPKVIKGSRNYIIDESGFLVMGSTMASNLSKKRSKVPGGKKVTNQSNKKHTLPLQSKPLVQTNIFNEIRLHKSKKPVTIKKKGYAHIQIK